MCSKKKKKKKKDINVKAFNMITDKATANR